MNEALAICKNKERLIALEILDIEHETEKQLLLQDRPYSSDMFFCLKKICPQLIQIDEFNGYKRFRLKGHFTIDTHLNQITWNNYLVAKIEREYGGRLFKNIKLNYMYDYNEGYVPYQRLELFKDDMSNLIKEYEIRISHPKIRKLPIYRYNYLLICWKTNISHDIRKLIWKLVSDSITCIIVI